MAERPINYHMNVRLDARTNRAVALSLAESSTDNWDPGQGDEPDVRLTPEDRTTRILDRAEKFLEFLNKED